MNWHHAFRVTCSGFLIGVHQAFAEKIHFIGVVAVYSAIMVIFSGLIRMIPDADLIPFDLSHNQMVWYLGTTEFVLFTCSSWGMKEVQNDFMTGQSELGLLRPFPDSFLRIALWAGQALARTLLLFPAYLAIMYGLGGAIPMNFTHFVGLLLSMPAASFMMLCATYMIGASCLWFVQAEPAMWIWQKALFLFGAMIWPVIFYPVWMQALVWFTPFPGILMLAGNWTLDMSPLSYLLGFLHQLVWCSAFYRAVVWLDRRVLAKIQSGGA